MVDLLCTLCTRIRSYSDLLLIFFHDKHWYQSLVSPTIFDIDEEEEEEMRVAAAAAASVAAQRPSSPAPSSASTVTSAPVSAVNRKPEYEFLIFNYLMRYAHREGKIGDLARAGILMLIDVAMTAGDAAEDTPTNDPLAEASLALAEYILDGDFAEVLCAGLGAAYSQLPTKLEVRRPPVDESDGGGGMTLGGLTLEERKELDIKEAEDAVDSGIYTTTSPDVQARLGHFLRLLAFVQDVLVQNTVSPSSVGRPNPRRPFSPVALVGAAITQAVLDYFRTTFLMNVLYPSILESSVDDGSAVAVMFYIQEMLYTIQEASMTDLLLAFLMSDEDDPERPRPKPRVPERVLDGKKLKKAKKDRRKSSAMVLLEQEAPRPDGNRYFASLGRFTLKDLLVHSLRHPMQPSATAALRLLRLLFMDHCHLAVDGLLTVIRDPMATNFPKYRQIQPTPPTLPPRPPSPDSDDDTFLYPGSPDEIDALPQSLHVEPFYVQPETTLAVHERELDLYLGLVSRVLPTRPDGGEETAFSTGYENYIRDAMDTVRGESCFVDEADEARTVPQHKLLPTDSLIAALLQSLRLFFSHSPEHNIALTGVLSIISACPHRSVTGWLTITPPSPDEGDWPEETSRSADDEDGDDKSIDFSVDELLSSGVKPSAQQRNVEDNPKTLPVLYVILSGLINQLDRYRRLVDDFDRYLSERRQGLLFAENINDALNLSMELSFSPSTTTPNRPKLPSSAAPLPKTPSSSPAPAKPKPKSKGSFLFTPLRRKRPATPPPDPVTPTRPSHGMEKSFPSSPFTPHFQQTGAIDVQPFVAPAPIAGPYSPAPRRVRYDLAEDVFSAPAPAPAEEETEDVIFADVERRAAPKVTLSQLLDNVVILEESIKELAAILQVRRILGIDSLRYL